VDKSSADFMLSSISLVQAAAGDRQAALQTADGISSLDTKTRAYGRIIDLLIMQGHLADAKQVSAAMKEEWLPWGGSMAALQSIAKAYAGGGESKDALAWARQQQNAYAKARTLLGVAEGVMEQKGVETIEPKVRDMPMHDNCPSL
jgi:hypothetical protein